MIGRRLTHWKDHSTTNYMSTRSPTKVNCSTFFDSFISKARNNWHRDGNLPIPNLFAWNWEDTRSGNESECGLGKEVDKELISFCITSEKETVLITKMTLQKSKHWLQSSHLCVLIAARILLLSFTGHSSLSSIFVYNLRKTNGHHIRFRLSYLFSSQKCFEIRKPLTCFYYELSRFISLLASGKVRDKETGSSQS